MQKGRDARTHSPTPKHTRWISISLASRAVAPKLGTRPREGREMDTRRGAMPFVKYGYFGSK